LQNGHIAKEKQAMASRKRVLMVGAVGCAASLGILLGVGWMQRAFARSFDLSAAPPGEAFEKVFAITPPPSIDALKIAGEANLNGVAWMRLHANDVDAALTALKRSPRGVTGPDKEYNKDFEEQMDVHDPSSPKYKRAVGWEAIKQVQHPESYSFPPLFQGTGWRGVIIVDRRRKLLFVEAQLF
jgi:hypothetical protein